MKNKSLYTAILMIFGFLILTSCATIMNSTTQQISVSSMPSGATVKLNGMLVGETPLSLDVKRKNGGVVRIEKEGYETAEIILVKKTNGWVFGNILFGGIPGLIIDAIAGGMFTLKPETISVSMQGVNIDTGSTQRIIVPYELNENGLVIEFETADQEFTGILEISFTD